MKKILQTSGLLLTIILFTNFTTVNNSNTKKILGTWEYAVPDAPYEYQKGELVIKKTDGKLSGYTESDGYKTDIEDIVVDGKNVTFIMYIENTEIEFDLTFDKNSFKGTVSYTEGTLDISGIKKE